MSWVGNNKHLNIQDTSLLSNAGEKGNRINKSNLKCESIFQEMKENPWNIKIYETKCLRVILELFPMSINEKHKETSEKKS